MAIVTDLQYALENRLLKKLDIMISRCEREHPKKDAVLINEGPEGEGKTGSSICEGYYVKYKTKRDMHLFFRLEPLIDFAKTTYNKIIIWDEPSLDSLSADHMRQLNKDLLRLFMTIRKRRHFFIINFTKFYKFPEYVVVDRALALVHMYSRKEIHPGRFLYIRKKRLEKLWNAYRSSKKREYKKFSSFGGVFPDIMEKHFDKMKIYINGKVATFKDYEKAKDEAIESIGQENASKIKQELRILKHKIGMIKDFPIKNRTDLAVKLDCSIRVIQKWEKMDTKDSMYSQKWRMARGILHKGLDSDEKENKSTEDIEDTAEKNDTLIHTNTHSDDNTLIHTNEPDEEDESEDEL